MCSALIGSCYRRWLTCTGLEETVSLVEATRCPAHSLSMPTFSQIKQINKQRHAGQQPLLVPVPVRACRYRDSRAERVGVEGFGWGRCCLTEKFQRTLTGAAPGNNGSTGASSSTFLRADVTVRWAQAGESWGPPLAAGAVNHGSSGTARRWKKLLIRWSVRLLALLSAWSGPRAASREWAESLNGKMEEKEREEKGREAERLAGGLAARRVSACVCGRVPVTELGRSQTDRQTDRGLTLLAHVTYDTFSYIVVVRAGLSNKNVTKCYFYHHWWKN